MWDKHTIVYPDGTFSYYVDKDPDCVEDYFLCVKETHGREKGFYLCHPMVSIIDRQLEQECMIENPEHIPEKGYSSRPVFFLIELLLHTNRHRDYANFYNGYSHSIRYSSGNMDIVKLLINYGANIDVGHSINGPGISYLTNAVYCEDYEMVKLLLDYGANPYYNNIKGECGNILEFSERKNKTANKIRKLVFEKMLEYNTNMTLVDIV